MRHKKDKRKLKPTSSHRKAMLMNMVKNLIIYENIKTTLTKAKETRRMADKVINLAKDDNLKNKRMVYDILQSHSLTSRVFSEVGPRFKKRQGGYTRIIPLNERPGDGAQLVYLRLVELKAKTSGKSKVKKETSKAKPELKSEERPKKATKQAVKDTDKASDSHKKTEEKKEKGFLNNLRKYLGKDKKPEQG